MAETQMSGSLAAALKRAAQRRLARQVLGIQLGQGGNYSGDQLRQGGFGFAAATQAALQRPDLTDEQRQAVQATSAHGFLPTHHEMVALKRARAEGGGHADRTAMLTGGPKPQGPVAGTPGRPVLPNLPNASLADLMRQLLGQFQPR
jgi:hypothetical protein